MKNAPVILVIGPSSAGKSTLIEEVLRQDAELPADQKLNWQKFGPDAVTESVLHEADKAFLAELKDHPLFQKIQKLNPKFLEVEAPEPYQTTACNRIFEAIAWYGALEYQGCKLDLLDDEKFNSQLSEFLKNTDDKFFNEEILRALQTLTKEKHPTLRPMAEKLYAIFDNQEEIEKIVFDHAIQCSKNGKPILLDLAPHTLNGQNLPQRFANYCEQQGHQCPTHTALTYLPFNSLSKRLEDRNKKAAEQDNPSNARIGIFLLYILQQLSTRRLASLLNMWLVN